MVTNIVLLSHSLLSHLYDMGKKVPVLSMFMYDILAFCFPRLAILVPRSCAPFGQHQESRPLARSNDIPVLNGLVNTIDRDKNQSDLSSLSLSMRRVTESPWIADFRRSTAVKWVRMLKPRARVEMDCTVSIETCSAKMAADLNFAVCVSFREDKPKTKQLRLLL